MVETRSDCIAVADLSEGEARQLCQIYELGSCGTRTELLQRINAHFKDLSTIRTETARQYLVNKKKCDSLPADGNAEEAAVSAEGSEEEKSDAPPQ